MEEGSIDRTCCQGLFLLCKQLHRSFECAIAPLDIVLGSCFEACNVSADEYHQCYHNAASDATGRAKWGGNGQNHRLELEKDEKSVPLPAKLSSNQSIDIKSTQGK
jgi:hypothetical protein